MTTSTTTENTTVEENSAPVDGTTETSETTESPEFTITLKNQQCAVVFGAKDGEEKNDGYEVFLPQMEKGAPITGAVWMTFLVQELLKDSSLMEVLAHRVVASDMVSTTPTPPEATTTEATTTEDSEIF